MTLGTQQSRQCLENIGIVVDQEDDETRVARHVGAMATWVGNVKAAVVPPLALFCTVSFPPCDLTIVEQIDRPRPNPNSLVVKKGWNSCACASAVSPRPRSVMIASRCPVATRVVTFNSRCRGGSALIAST